LVGQVVVGGVGSGSVQALIARVALPLVVGVHVVGIQLAVCGIAGSIGHGIWWGI